MNGEGWLVQYHWGQRWMEKADSCNITEDRNEWRRLTRAISLRTEMNGEGWLVWLTPYQRHLPPEGENVSEQKTNLEYSLKISETFCLWTVSYYTRHVIYLFTYLLKHWHYRQKSKHEAINFHSPWNVLCQTSLLWSQHYLYVSHFFRSI